MSERDVGGHMPEGKDTLPESDIEMDEPESLAENDERARREEPEADLPRPHPPQDS